MKTILDIQKRLLALGYRPVRRALTAPWAATEKAIFAFNLGQRVADAAHVGSITL